MKAGLFSFVRIKDESHEHFGKTGQITDYDTLDKQYILHFDKITELNNVYWCSESTRVTTDQVECITKWDLERIS